MFGKRSVAGYLLSSIIILSITSSGLPVYSQDLIASDDLVGGGASVFVFRESRKKPQARASAGGGVVTRAGGGRAAKRRVDSAYFASARKRRATGRPTTGSRGRGTPAATARIKLSTSLTAKADALLDAKQTDEAIATYREALKNNPKNLNASAGLSDALTAKGIEAAGDSNSKAGVVYLNEAVTRDPRNDVAFAKLGEIFAAGDQTERAIQNYEKAVVINPHSAAVLVALGLAYLKTGEIAKAETYSAKAVAEGPATADSEFLRGLLFYKQNKNAEALAAFQKTLSIDGNYSSARYYEAVTYERLNQGDQSIAALRKTVESDPEYAPAWFDLGVAYYNAGDYNNALAAYQQSIKFDPNNPDAHANLASTYRQLERYPEANAEYKQAEALGDKKNPDLYSEWGYCLGKTNEWDKSTARLIAARELSPTAIDNTNVGWAYYNAGQADKANKKDAEAAANLEKSKASLQTAVQQDPKLDAAYVNLGATNNALGNYDEAVVALNTALSLHNDWVIAMNLLGLGYRGQNNLSAAIAQFNRVVTIDGNNVRGLFNLGSAQYASGDKKGAKKTQDRLAKLDSTLAGQLGNIIAGKVVDEGVRQIKKKIRIPGIPF